MTEQTNAEEVFPTKTPERRMTSPSHGQKLLPTKNTTQDLRDTDTQQPFRKPVVITDALLIDRYMKHSNEKTATTLEQSHKYLWMHTAWMMAETLRHTTDDTPLRVPTNPLYIELEQPRQIHKQNVAAFSFFPTEGQRWMLSVINDQGHMTWSALYEGKSWRLPYNYRCPEQQCTIDEKEGDRIYTLCETCQKRFTHYTSWLAIALRMIAGDFQEQVELREPEYILETSTKAVPDKQTGEIKETPTLHRYRIIRYYDACERKSGEPQTKRGSWMSNRPLAENEYEVNPHAIIYVQIQPRDYHRTYQHERYTYARGKTQHVEPGPRYQPMTIATFKQLKRIQRITRVFASKFEE